MPTLTQYLSFALFALVLAITPGPNIAYLVSRSISQGWRAGFISLIGIAAAFVIYMLCAVFGLTAIILNVPLAYDVLRFGGACYLLYLAWQALRPGGRSPFQVYALKADGTSKLLSMGFLTSLLNPKVAVFYVSVIPQFIDPARGYILEQSLLYGFTQIIISVMVNSVVIIAAGSIALFLARKPNWLMVQRWITGLVLAGFALRMAFEGKR